MGRLKGKVALITGASSGIGRATAQVFAQEGAALVLGARREKELAHLVTEIKASGGSAVSLPGDVTSEDYNLALVNLALKTFKKLDITFNNAGTLGQAQSVGFLAAKHQIPALLNQGGSMIFTSSFVGYSVGFPMQGAYAASKAGLIGMTYSLASEFSPRGIRVNCILPGGTDTPMADSFGNSPEVKEFVNGIHALKRIAAPEEIAKSVLYLASEDSSFTTGSAMLVDGGVSICKT